MTTYNTGNPIGSTDARDLYDNAQNLDNFANGAAASYTDRFGVSRRSLAGIDAAADNVLNSIGYAVPVAYASGISLTLTSQTVDYNGVIYAPLSSALPFTTSSWGTDSAKFRAVQVTDAAYLSYTPAGTGAVATTVQQQLRNIQEWSVNVKDAPFYAKGDGVTDDSNAIEAAILAAYNAAILDGGLRRGCALYFPRGQYRISQPSKLFSSIPSQAGGSASFHWRGDGSNDGYASNIGSSVLVFDPPTGATSEHLINNNNKIAWCKFEKLGFVSSNGGTFWNGQTGSGIQSFEFRECAFKGFTDLFNVGGTSNNSEWSFFQCKFSGFSGRAFYLNNEQAVSWRFFGCDAEVFSGTLLEYGKGANVAWYSGSIIPTTSTARIVKVPAGASGFGVNNAPHLVFDAARFELRDGALLTEKLTGIAPIQVVFRDCGMGGFNIPTSPSIPKVLYWRGNGQVSFMRCQNMQKYYWDYATDGNDTDENATLNVVMQDCKALDSAYLSGSTFVLTSGTANVSRLPLFTVSGCGRRFDGVYRPKSSSRREMTSLPRSISFSAEGGRIQLVGVGAGWPQSTDLYLPPVLVHKVGFFPINTSDFGASTATITIKDKSGATLWTVTYTMNAVPAPSETLINKKLTETDEYLRFEFSSSYTGGVAVPFLGSLFLHY